MTRALTCMIPLLLLSIACSESESGSGGTGASGGVGGSGGGSTGGAAGNAGTGAMGGSAGSAAGSGGAGGMAGTGAAAGAATGGSAGSGGAGGASTGGASAGGASAGGASSGGASGASTGGTSATAGAGGFDPGTRPKGQCTKDADCPGNICNHAVPGGQCQGGGCPAGSVNEPGIGCIIECAATDDCPWGMECSTGSGRCIIMACTGGVCPVPVFACGATNRCARKDCGMQSDCPASTTCTGGHCIEDWAL